MLSISNKKEEGMGRENRGWEGKTREGRLIIQSFQIPGQQQQHFVVQVVPTYVGFEGVGCIYAPFFSVNK